MVQWLAPVATFWTLAALWLGGAALRIEGGRGGQHLLGLALTFVLYLAVWALARSLLRAPLGGNASVAVAIILAAALIPILARIAFRVAGVRIRALSASHG